MLETIATGCYETLLLRKFSITTGCFQLQDRIRQLLQLASLKLAIWWLKLSKQTSVPSLSKKWKQSPKKFPRLSALRKWKSLRPPLSRNTIPNLNPSNSWNLTITVTLTSSLTRIFLINFSPPHLGIPTTMMKASSWSPSVEEETTERKILNHTTHHMLATETGKIGRNTCAPSSMST